MLRYYSRPNYVNKNNHLMQNKNTSMACPFLLLDYIYITIFLEGDFEILSS